jgi:hypothetical protein
MGAAGRAVLGSPVLIVLPLLLVFAMWLGLIAAGLDHAPQGMHDLLALPPISSFFDLNIAVTTVGFNSTTLWFMAGATVARAAIWGILVGLVVESVEEGRVSMAGVRRGLRAFPTMLAILLAYMGLIFLSQILRFVLGASIGTLGFFLALVGGLLILAFAPTVAVRDRVAAREALARSTRAARLPGSRHVGLVLLYFTISFFAFVPTSRAYTINPTLTSWLFVLALTLLHTVMLAAFTYRYIEVEDDIPPPRPRPARTPLLGRR